MSHFVGMLFFSHLVSCFSEIEPPKYLIIMDDYICDNTEYKIDSVTISIQACHTTTQIACPLQTLYFMRMKTQSSLRMFLVTTLTKSFISSYEMMLNM